jgi:cysteine-rich repeat protein
MTRVFLCALLLSIFTNPALAAQINVDIPVASEASMTAAVAQFNAREGSNLSIGEWATLVIRQAMLRELREKDIQTTLDGNVKTRIATWPICGDGVVGGTEACDDGNRVAGDGCEPNCTVTPTR